jgi:hypothetical protein
MRRREVFVLLSGTLLAVLWSRSGAAETTPTILRVGMATIAPRRAPHIIAFVERMAVLGFLEHYEGATTPTRRITGHLFVSLPVPTRILLISCSLLPALPGRVEAPSRARIHCSTGDPVAGCSHVDVSGTSEVPRLSILCLCPGPRPRPN